MKREFLPAILLCSALLAPFRGFGGTYYVSTSGNDNNPGSLSQPWRTVQHAADVVVAGDMVYIRGGVYSEQVTVSNGGNATGGPIVISGYQGEEAVIDGTGVVTGNNGFIVQSSYVKILNLTVRNWNDTDIWVQGPVGFIEITGCKVYNALGCISFTNGVHDFVLNDNEMYDFGFYGFDATSEPGFPVSYNGSVNNCYSHDGDPGQNCDGFALGHSEHRNISFNRCRVEKTFDGFDITGHKITLNRCSVSNCFWGGYKLWSDSIYLENCIAFGCQVTNLELDGGENPSPDPLYAPKKITLRNCTFYDAGTWNILVPGSSGNDSLEMYNCIIAGGDNIGIGFGEDDFSTYKGDYNVFHNDNAFRVVAFPTDDISVDMFQSGGWTNLTGQDAHSKVVTDVATLFMDVNSPDLHLLEGAVAIDNGTANGSPLIDYDGCPRPYNGLYDIGADEFSPCEVGGLEEKVLIKSDHLLSQNYPNPCSSTTSIGFIIPVSEVVSLSLFDLYGNKVGALPEKRMPPGRYEIAWDCSQLQPGIYVYAIRFAKYAEYKKMIVIL